MCVCISPLTAKGTLREEGAGVVGDMARKAVKLSDRLTNGENPTIVVEFDTGYVPLFNCLQNVSGAWLCY